MLDESPWMFNGSIIHEPPPRNEFTGFVYLITNLESGRKYIGKKQFWAKRTRPPLKGQKRKRVDWIESDWKTYWSSCDELNKERTENPGIKWNREILHFCSTKAVMSYLETKEQLARDVLLNADEYYNGFVGCKIHRNHVIDKLTKCQHL